MAQSPHLNALPTELLVFVISNLNRVEDIAALALTNRRLYDTANTYLYRCAAQCDDGRPLAWAANRGLVSTLRMALAAGLEPDFEFIEHLSAEEWEKATASARADAAAGRPKQRWAMWDYNNRPRPETHGWSPDPAEDSSTPAAASPRAPSASDQDSVVSSEEDLSQRSDATPTTEPSPTPTPQTLSRRYHAIHLAARAGHNDIIEMLLRHGATINMSSQSFCACPRLKGLLNDLEHPDPEPSQPQWTPLHVAICHSHTETAKLLLSHDASPWMESTLTKAPSGNNNNNNSHNPFYGSTALHHASGMGLTTLIHHLLSTPTKTKTKPQPQPHINHPDDHTLTPLYHAYASRRWATTIPLLLTLGADINCETKMYIPYTAITPLGEACRLGDFDAANRLVELGADVGKGFLALTKTGCLTPLHMCCMRPARPAGESPGRAQGRGEVEEGGDDDDNEARRGKACMRTIEKLVARGASLDAMDCFGSTPLMAAVQACNTFALEALRIAGVDGDADGGGDGGGNTKARKGEKVGGERDAAVSAAS